MKMTNDRWIDLSHPFVSGMPIYPGDPEYRSRVASQDTENGFLVDEVAFGLHTSTHLDSPLHALKKGASIDQLPISRFIGEANVIRVAPKDNVIKTTDLEKAYQALLKSFSKLVIATGHESLWGKATYFDACPVFETDFPDWAESHHLELIGADLPTFWFAGGEALLCHQKLFEQGIVLLENLTHLESLTSTIFLVALPLAFQGLEASPVRAIAKNQKGIKKI